MASPTSIQVRAVTSRADRDAFIDWPYQFYPGRYPNWIAPLRREEQATLNPDKNAFFDHGEIQLFLAEDASGQVRGRIAAIINGMHLQKYDDDTGFFGFFETENDPAVANALLDAAEAWLRARDCIRMRGPTNPSLNDVSGLLVDGFDRRPSVLMPYNPPYYADLLTDYGFERAMTMWAYYAHKRYAKYDRLRRGVNIVKRRTPGLSLRTINPDALYDEARTLLDIYNEAWSDNWGHVPMTEAEFTQLVDGLKQVYDPRLVYFVEHKGEPVAFAISLPNINQALRHVEDGRLLPTGWWKLLMHTTYGISELRMPLMGIRKAYQGKGLDALMVLETMERGPEYGYDACETSWVLDTNERLKNAIESIGAVRDKEYALFEVALQ